MRKKSRKYTAGEIGHVRMVEDFLPSAETLRLNKRPSPKRTVRYIATELRAMEQRGEVKTGWKATAKNPLPSGADPTTRWTMMTAMKEGHHGSHQERTTDRFG